MRRARPQRATLRTRHRDAAAGSRSRYSGAVQPTDPLLLSRIARRVAELRVEHRDLDAAIARLQGDRDADELAVKRLKKRKLQIKDAIARLESDLIPDEPA